MSNNFYNHGIYPTPNAPGSSAALRAELDAISAGFDKLPTLTGNGNKVVAVNSGGTALTATSALGGLAITSSTVDSTVIGGTTPAAGTFTTLAANSATVGGVNVVTTSATQTLTNKTISGATNTLTNIANASLTNSSVTIGSTNVALGATATTLAGLTSVTSTTFVGALTGNATNVTGTVAVANGGTGATDAATARTNLGLAIGSDVQAYDADLAAIGAISATSGLLRKTAANTWSLDTSSYLTGNQTITFSGDATGSGTTSVALTLANSGVSAGTYNNVTVDAKGRVTVGSNVSYLTGNQTITFSGDATGSGTTSVALTLATVPVGKGGTGATTAAGARTNLLPSYSGNAGKVLAVNGGGTDVEFITVAGTGTVTSIDVSGGTTGLTTSGGPVTTNGTITLAGTLNVANGGTGATTLTGVVIGNGTSAFTTKTNPSGAFVGTSDVQTLINKTIDYASNTLTGVQPTLVSGTSIKTINGNSLLGSGNISITNDVTASGNNAFTGANTFYNGTGQTFGTSDSAQDGIVIAGRAGGISSHRVTLAPGNLTASRSVTFPDAAGAVVIDSATQTLTNKTLTGPVISTINNTGVLTLPTSTDTLVGRATTDNLSNKTFINTTTYLASSTATQDGLAFVGRAGGTGSFRVTVSPATLSANRAVTFPDAAGAVVLDTATQTLANKTISGATLSGFFDGNVTYTGASTFGNASGQTFLASTTTTQDGVVINGRAGGTTSLRVTIAPTTLTASRAQTLPDAAGTFVLDTATQTLTNKTLSTSTSLAADVTGGDFLLTRVMLQDTGWDYHDNGGGNTLNYVNGSVQRWAVNTGSQTLSITNWPPSGNLGELLIEGVNLGAATITWPTINWVNPDGSFTTTAATYFSNANRTLKTSGTDFVFLWTRDAGTTIYGKLI